MINSQSPATTQNKTLFNNKYVEGIVFTSNEKDSISLASIHSGNSHIESSVVIIRKEITKENLKLNDSIWLKVESENGIPVAKEVYKKGKDNAPKPSEKYGPIPKTGLDLHSIFTVHNKTHAHKKRHIIPGTFKANAQLVPSSTPTLSPNTTYTIKMSRIDGSDEKEYIINYDVILSKYNLIYDHAFSSNAQNLSVVFITDVEFDDEKTYILTDIDTVHKHEDVIQIDGH